MRIMLMMTLVYDLQFRARAGAGVGFWEEDS